MSEAPVYFADEINSTDKPIPSLSAQPVQEAERIRAIDVLRGFALLGILPVNMIAFAHVEQAYENPTLAGGFTGLNYLVWLVTHVIFEGKMVTLFSMLFGAGLFLQVDRVEQRRGKVGSARGLYFRRVGWLFIFGLVHAYLLWFGDILTYYALIGMLVYWMRRWRPRTLVILGGVLILIGSLIMVGFSWTINGAMNDPKAAKEVQKLQEEFNPSAEKVEKESAAVRQAGFIDSIKRRAGVTAAFQLKVFWIFGLWRITGLMLWGIALIRWGGLALQWSSRGYWKCVAVGLGVGIPLTLLGTHDHQLHPTEFTQFLMTSGTTDYFGSLYQALGYFGLVMLMVRQGWLRALQDSLAAVGRMAFTNYLMHTLICTFIFNGWGLAQFGLWSRSELFLLVLSIWLLQLVVSPIWLSYFRFGPFEWLWRSLTYVTWQPMLKAKQW